MTEARDMLYKMVKVEGLLRIITNQCVSPNCKGDSHDESEYHLTDPRHFVVHEVVKLEERPDGTMLAHSAEGDWTWGLPEALLRRLQRWNMGGTIAEVPRSRGGLLSVFRRR